MMISSLCSFLRTDSESAMVINKKNFCYLLQAVSSILPTNASACYGNHGSPTWYTFVAKVKHVWKKFMVINSWMYKEYQYSTAFE